MKKFPRVPIEKRKIWKKGGQKGPRERAEKDRGICEKSMRGEEVNCGEE